VAALLLASCAPAVTEEEEVAPAPGEEVVVTEEEVAPSPEGPQYGGVISVVLGVPFYGFDICYTIPPLTRPPRLTHQELLTGDWAKGPAGTGEVSWQIDNIVPTCEVPCLCESWEVADEETIVFHIRKGVHFHDKPPVNGREMTADDVVYSIQHTGLSDLPLSWKTLYGDKNITSAEATDRYTVVVKCPPGSLWQRIRDVAETMPVLAPEVGGPPPGDYRDWHTCIGTGPFMIVDEVIGSALTFVKNPNFWMKDPVHPENTLPYVDRFNWLIIPDASTRLAAMRTGKIDQLGGQVWEDKESLLKSNPELPYVDRVSHEVGGSGGGLISMRTDLKPFDDIRVRKALSMAIDLPTLVDEYYGGQAEIFGFPIEPTKEFECMYTPLDEVSESIRENYVYNPEKARQLLADAGYPDGFHTSILCTQGEVDLMSVYKAYWADIGVDVDIDVRERGTYQAICRAHTQEGLIIGRGGGGDQLFREFIPGLDANRSMVDDPYVLDLYYNKLSKDVWDWETYCRVVKEELSPYVMEQCWYIDPPRPVQTTFWQPWIKGYHGEGGVGSMNAPNWVMYVWVDQELKREMGH